MQSVSPRSLRRVRWAVRAALTLGIAASVAANVLHAQPNTIARVIAAWPPIALLITLELVARVPVRRWPGWVRAGATAVIAGIAAWVSYWHMAGVAARYGEAADAAHLLPLSVDGLIIVASVSLVELSARIRADDSPAGSRAQSPAKTSAAVAPKPLVSLEKSSRQNVSPPSPDNAPTAVPADPDRERRATALAALARGDDREQVATTAGVTLRTLQRWADQAAAVTRTPRGGARRATTDPTAADDREAVPVP